MKLSKILVTLMTVGMTLIAQNGVLMAASEAANLPVNVNVAANCSITTVGVIFPDAYDPVELHASASSNDDGTGSIIVTCTKGAGTNIALNNGANAQGNQPRMRGPGAGGSEHLRYTLYSDSGRAVVWSGTTYAIGAAPSKAARTFTVYARIPGGQDISQGAYSDTVVATVNF